jgi:hypothetical protein
MAEEAEEEKCEKEKLQSQPMDQEHLEGTSQPFFLF